MPFLIRIKFLIFIVVIVVSLFLAIYKLNLYVSALDISGSNIYNQNIQSNVTTSLILTIYLNQTISSSDNIKVILNGFSNNEIFSTSNVQIIGCSGSVLIASPPKNTVSPTLIISGINCPTNSNVVIHLIDNSLKSVDAVGTYSINIFVNNSFYDAYTIFVGDENTVVVSGQIDYNLKFKLYPEKRTPSNGNWGNIYRIQFIDPITKVVVYEKSNIVANNNGEFEEYINYNNLPPGVYIIGIKGTSHLLKEFNNIQIKNNTNFYDLTTDGVYLLAGDVSLVEDDVINSLDISRLENTLFTDTLRSDLNRDGYVNSLDFSILAVNIKNYNVYGESID